MGRCKVPCFCFRTLFKNTHYLWMEIEHTNWWYYSTKGSVQKRSLFSLCTSNLIWCVFGTEYWGERDKAEQCQEWQLTKHFFSFLFVISESVVKTKAIWVVENIIKYCQKGVVIYCKSNLVWTMNLDLLIIFTVHNISLLKK